MYAVPVAHTSGTCKQCYTNCISINSKRATKRVLCAVGSIQTFASFLAYFMILCFKFTILCNESGAIAKLKHKVTNKQKHKRP